MEKVDVVEIHCGFIGIIDQNLEFWDAKMILWIWNNK